MAKEIGAKLHTISIVTNYGKILVSALSKYPQDKWSKADIESANRKAV